MFRIVMLAYVLVHGLHLLQMNLANA